MLANATYTCAGVPKGVAMGSGGTVVIESLGGLNWTYLCNVDSSANGIAVSACKSLYASLLASELTGRSMTLWFNNAVGSCAANTAWSFGEGLYFWRVD